MKNQDILKLIVTNAVYGRISNVMLTNTNIALKTAITNISLTAHNTPVPEYGFDKTITADNLRPAIIFEASKPDYININLQSLANISDISLERLIQSAINTSVKKNTLLAYAGCKTKNSSPNGTTHASWSIKTDFLSIVREILRNQLKVIHLQDRRINPLNLSLDNVMDICIQNIKDGTATNNVQLIKDYTTILDEVISARKVCYK